jgi:2-deoxy-D-gluconate 3-dehydrogenase
MSNGMFDLGGKVAIVTGGNGGIGLGIARGLAEHGANIVVAARNEEKTSAAIEEIEAIGVKAIGLRTDVKDEPSVKGMIASTLGEFGRIDILVNNAGIGIRKDPQDYTLDEWNQIIDINLTGTFLPCREVFSHMKGQGGGKIVNIGSMTSIFGHDFVMPYSASKGGVVQLSKSLAIAWAKYNIQVNTILPGWIETDLTEPLRREERFAERYKLISARIPHGRWGVPNDMAGTAVFLSSSASDYVTGVSIPVDGGYTSF